MKFRGNDSYKSIHTRDLNFIRIKMIRKWYDKKMIWLENDMQLNTDTNCCPLVESSTDVIAIAVLSLIRS